MYSASSRITIRLPFIVRSTGCSVSLFLRVLVLIEFAPVADLVHEDGLGLHAKTQAVIAGSQTIPSRQVAGQGLGPADLGPVLQPLEHPVHAATDGARQTAELPDGFGRQPDSDHGCEYGRL